MLFVLVASCDHIGPQLHHIQTASSVWNPSKPVPNGPSKYGQEQRLRLDHFNKPSNWDWLQLLVQSGLVSVLGTRPLSTRSDGEHHGTQGVKTRERNKVIDEFKVVSKLINK